MAAASTRSILHVDMDAFYASIEQRDNEEIRNKPVVVGGGNNRGVVAAASYEARKFGIRSAMPTAEAIRRCPDLIRIAPRMSHYKSVSRTIFEVFRQYTPLVEGLSLDEAFLDVTGSVGLFGSAERIAADIKKAIRLQVQLTASVGVAENKLVAKIASDLDKPDGLTELYPEHYAARLDPLPVSVIPGIGRKKIEQLTRCGISTVCDLRTAKDGDLEAVFGRYSSITRNRAAGIDDRPVQPERQEKSISAEETYDRDLTDKETMDRELLRLSDKTAARLRKSGLSAGTISVKIRRADFTTFTRQRSIKPPTANTDQIYHLARQLLRSWLADNSDAAIRLLGVGSSALSAARQTDLFAADSSEQRPVVDDTVDEIRKKFGSLAMGRASTLRHD